VRWLGNDKLNTVAMVLFFAIWAYSEVAERISANQFEADFKAFHDAGARFTHEEGDAMREQMDIMQEQVDRLIEVESVEHPELR
jgi:hypothetical protein